jgi:cytidyltransferase-like protein
MKTMKKPVRGRACRHCLSLEPIAKISAVATAVASPLSRDQGERQSMNRVRAVMVTGTFDLLHKGHLHLFKEAQIHGNRLIVVLARDFTILKEKGHNPLHDERKRLVQIQRLPFVDKAILGNKRDKLSILNTIKPDILALGYDQKIPLLELKAYIKSHHLPTKIVRLHAYYPNIYKSSKLKKKL